MNAAVQPKISAFPFDQLPRETWQDVQLRNRLMGLYGLTLGTSQILEKVTVAVSDLLRTPVKLRLDRFELLPAEVWTDGLGDRSLVAMARIDPLAVKAALAFDAAFAHVAWRLALTDGRSSWDGSLAERLRPTSPLQEAVVEYLAASTVEAIGQSVGASQLRVIYEGLFHDTKKVTAQLAKPGESIAALTFVLSGPGRDVAVRMALPVSVAERLSPDLFENEYFRERLVSFKDFRIELALEAGRVELSTADLAGLEDGDLVFLDSTDVFVQNGVPSGEAMLRPAGAEGDSAGFVVKLIPGESSLSAEIVETIET